MSSLSLSICVAALYITTKFGNAALVGLANIIPGENVLHDALIDTILIIGSLIAVHIYLNQHLEMPSCTSNPANQILRGIIGTKFDELQAQARKVRKR